MLSLSTHRFLHILFVPRVTLALVVSCAARSISQSWMCWFHWHLATPMSAWHTDPSVPAPPQSSIHARLQAKKWAKLSKQKWAAKRQHGHSEAQKEELAPEIVRKIVKDHGDMTSRKCAPGHLLALIGLTWQHLCQLAQE